MSARCSTISANIGKKNIKSRKLLLDDRTNFILYSVQLFKKSFLLDRYGTRFELQVPYSCKKKEKNVTEELLDKQTSSSTSWTHRRWRRPSSPGSRGHSSCATRREKLAAKQVSLPKHFNVRIRQGCGSGSALIFWVSRRKKMTHKYRKK